MRPRDCPATMAVPRSRLPTLRLGDGCSDAAIIAQTIHSASFLGCLQLSFVFVLFARWRDYGPEPPLLLLHLAVRAGGPTV
jgi:hypothetical protein